MNNYLFKIMKTLPFCLAVLLITTVAYGFLRWLLTFYFEITTIKEDVWEYVLPLIISLVVCWITTRKRYWIIKEQEHKKSDFRGFLQLLPIIALFVMLMFSQSFVVSHFSTLQRVSSIEQISNHTSNLYYELDKFDINQSRMGSYVDSRTIPKRSGSNLEFTIYLVFPFENRENVWYAISTSKTINNTSEKEIQQKYNAFLDRSNKMISDYDFTRYHVFKRVDASSDRDGFLEAIKQEYGNKYVSKDAIILSPQEEGYTDKSNNKLNYIFITLAIWLWLNLIILYFAPIDNTFDTTQLARKKKTNKIDDLSSELLRIIFIPNRLNWLFPIIIDIIILYYIVMIINGVGFFASSAHELFKWGALRSESLYNGEWWRVISSMFMHANILHLLGNIVVLAIITLFTTNLLSTQKTAIIFIISGIFANTTAALLFDGTYVGSSGAIMGVMGATFAIYALYRKRVNYKGLFSKDLLPLVLTASMTLLAGISKGISNTAHITGLITGAIIGLLLFKAPTQKPKANNSNH